MSDVKPKNSVIEHMGNTLGGSVDLPGIQNQFAEWVYNTLRGNETLAREILNSMHLDTEKFLNEDSSVALEALQKELTLTQRFTILARMLLNETLGEFLPDVGKSLVGKELVLAPLKKEIERLKKKGGAVIAQNNNVFYPSSEALLGGLDKLMNLAALVEKGPNGRDQLRVVTGTTKLVPQSTEGSDSVFAVSWRTQMAEVLAKMKPPVTLHTVGLDWAQTHLPKDDEVQVISVNPELPLTEDGKRIDKEGLVKHLSLLFDRGNVEWDGALWKLGAAVLVFFKGLSPQEALKAVGVTPLSGEYEPTLALLLDKGEEVKPEEETEEDS